MSAIAQRGFTHLNVSDARHEALFASALQPSETPTADMVAEAISCAVKQFGVRGCVRRMAQEFGDHPDAAAERMRWARHLAAWAWQTTRRHHASTRDGTQGNERDM
jgi:hypothetical protein